MKKIFPLLLVLIVCLSFCACGGNADTNESSIENASSNSKVDSDSESASSEKEDAWLQGSWIHDEYNGMGDSIEGTDLPAELLFKDGTVQFIDSGDDTPMDGTYIIEQDHAEMRVICTLSDKTLTFSRADEEMLICDDNEDDLYLIYFHSGNIPQDEGTGEEISLAEAESIAREYATGSECENLLLQKAKSKSMQFFEIASVSTTNGSGDFRVTIKGNFFGHDEYGVLKDHYNFTLTIPVAKNGGRVLTGSVSATVTSA